MGSFHCARAVASGLQLEQCSVHQDMPPRRYTSSAASPPGGRMGGGGQLKLLSCRGQATGKRAQNMGVPSVTPPHSTTGGIIRGGFFGWAKITGGGGIWYCSLEMKE